MDSVYFVRHAEPMADDSGGPHRWRLSDAGRQSTRRLAQDIAWNQVAFIASSHEVKAQETAEVLAESGGVDWHVVEGLQELRAPWFENPKMLAHRFTHYLESRHDPDFEDWDEALFRFERAVHAVMQASGSKRPVIVSHGRILTVYFRSRLGSSVSGSAWQHLQFPDCALYHVESNQIEWGFYAPKL